jgi:hypothetical protein
MFEGRRNPVPPHAPPGSVVGRYPPHAVLTRPVAALVLYVMQPKFEEDGAEEKTPMHPQGKEKT